MKKRGVAGLLFVLFIGLTSMASHKFYVGIHQINYASEKKMLQVTSRIFADDLNDALERKHNKKFYLGTGKETPEEISLMASYLISHFSIQVNGKAKPLNFLSKEIEGNVIICYFNSKDILKINALEIRNRILFDFLPEQQNMIQTTVYGKKNSLLLTFDKPSGVLKY